MRRRRRRAQLALLAALVLVGALMAAGPAAAQSDEGTQPDLLTTIRRLIQGSGEDDLEEIFGDQAVTQRLLEEESIRITVRVVAVGATLINLLPNHDGAPPADTPGLFAPTQDCGSVNGIMLPCWDDYLGDGEAGESLPYYPYAKRPNGCSVPGSVPGAHDTINLFGITISFTGVCNAHDRCYYTLGTNARDCNQALQIGLRARCVEIIDDRMMMGWDMLTLGTLAATALETCYTKADAMAVGVIGAEAIYHPKAQAMQAEYLARVDAYLETERAKAIDGQ